MSPPPLSPTTLPRWVEALPLSPQDHAVLIDALSPAPCYHKGLRASYLTPLHGWMDTQPLSARTPYQALRDALPQHAPFTFVPIAEILLLLTRASTLIWPNLSLTDGCNLVAESYIASMANHSMLSAMMDTCNHDLFEYLDLVSGSWHLWYNFGSRANRRASPLHMSMRYADTFAAAGALWQPGLNRGLLHLFNRPGGVRFTADSDTSFTVEVTLLPSLNDVLQPPPDKVTTP
jgi:hypothetical protein